MTNNHALDKAQKLTPTNGCNHLLLVSLINHKICRHLNANDSFPGLVWSVTFC